MMVQLPKLQTRGISLGDPNQATLIITNDDGSIISPTVQFASESYTTSEGNSEPLTLTVTRAGNGEGEVSVQYSVVPDGTAIADIDYSIDFLGTLTWVDGDSEPKSITLNLIDDKEFEEPETVHIQLFNTSDDIALGTPAEMILTIVDNDHVVPTSLGQGMGISTDGTLHNAVKLQNLFNTNVLFWGGAKVTGQDYTTTLFAQPTQIVKVFGEIHVDPKHVGKTADILMVVSMVNGDNEVNPMFLMLDNYEQMQTWNGDFATLVGIREDIVLPEIQLLETFHSFSEPANLQIYFGYRLQEDGFIYFNGEQPINVWVEEEHES